MTTEHYLWIVFSLLCVLLVIQIVTARRGPWEKPVPPDPPLHVRIIEKAKSESWS